MPLIAITTPRQPYPMPLTEQALYDAARVVQTAWVEAAQSGRFFHPGLGGYVRGILADGSLVYPLDGDTFAAAVVNIAPYAGAIEDGSPAYHLPAVIDWHASRAARRAKDGHFYLYVPFRHTVPRSGPGVTGHAQRSMMPSAVYAVAKRLQPRQRLTAGPSEGNRVHAPGLQPYVPAYAPNRRPGYTHASIHESMQRVGAARHTRYMTWRTLSERSPGWHIPPRPGTHIAATVAHEVSARVCAMVADAAALDIARHFNEELGGI